jgi:hypothetical protein
VTHSPKLTPEQVIALIADVANVISWQAGEPGMEIAAGIVSFLAAHPEHIDQFLTDPNEVMIGGAFDPHTGCLTWRTVKGEIINAAIYAERLAEAKARPSNRGEG